MGHKFHVALLFKVLQHLSQAVAYWGPRRKKGPRACRTRPALPAGGLDPSQLSRWNCYRVSKPFSTRRIYFHGGFHRILLFPTFESCRRKWHFKDNRLGLEFISDAHLLEAGLGLLGDSRKAIIAILTGICSKRVFLADMPASLTADCKITTPFRCGENL